MTRTQRSWPEIKLARDLIPCWESQGCQAFFEVIFMLIGIIGYFQPNLLRILPTGGTKVWIHAVNRGDSDDRWIHRVCAFMTDSLTNAKP